MKVSIISSIDQYGSSFLDQWTVILFDSFDLQHCVFTLQLWTKTNSTSTVLAHSEQFVLPRQIWLTLSSLCYLDSFGFPCAVCGTSTTMFTLSSIVLVTSKTMTYRFTLKISRVFYSCVLLWAVCVNYITLIWPKEYQLYLTRNNMCYILSTKIIICYMCKYYKCNIYSHVLHVLPVQGWFTLSRSWILHRYVLLCVTGVLSTVMAYFV